MITVDFNRRLPYPDAEGWLDLSTLLQFHYTTCFSGMAYSRFFDLDETTISMCDTIVRNGGLLREALKCGIPPYEAVQRSTEADCTQFAIECDTWNHLSGVILEDASSSLGAIATLSVLLSGEEDTCEVRRRPVDQLPPVPLVHWYLNKSAQVRIRLCAIIFRMLYVVSRTDNKETPC